MRRAHSHKYGALSLCIGAMLLSILSCKDEAQKLRELDLATPQILGKKTSTQPLKQETDTAVSLLEELRYCETRHRGLVIDTGSDWSNAHRSFMVGPFSDVRFTKRAGKHTGAVHRKKLAYDFWLDRPATGIHIGTRVTGERSTRLTLSVDGRLVGQRRLKSESLVFDFGPIEQELAPGRHQILLRANGRAKGNQPFFLLDWIRIFLPDNIAGHYAPATQQNIVRDVAIGGKPRRSIALRAPGSVRCGIVPQVNSRLKVDVGYWGEGEGVAQISAQLGRGQSVILAERKVVGGKDPKWLSLDLSLEGLNGKLVALELAALEASNSGRIVFGEPQLVSANKPAPAERAQNVILIVNSGVRRKLIPPWGDRKGLNNVFRLSEEGVTFDNYRTDTVLSSAAIATLLTDLPSSQHRLTDPAARLPSSVQLISERLRKSGAATAFFTNVPFSFKSFGFDKAWGTYKQTSPVKDQPGSAALLQAKQWLKQRLEENPDESRFVVIHSRGGHPPWDVTSEEASLLPPKDYSGVIEPRRAAVVLRQVRNRRRRHRRRLGPNDWQRVEALQRVSLQKQDVVLGGIIRALESHKQWDKTLLIWMGDVGMGSTEGVPFAPFPELDESRLMPPLVIKFAGPASQERRNSTPIQTIDVAHTLFNGIGLQHETTLAEQRPLPGMVLTAASRLNQPLETGMLAMRGSDYVFYLGPYRLSGALAEKPKLCDLTVDPACQNDLYAEDPMRMEWLWRLTLRALDRNLAQTGAPERQSASISKEDRAALSVFGL